MLKKFLALSLLVAGFQASASELDQPANRPNALVVREDAAGRRDVYKVDLDSKVVTDDAALAATSRLNDSNRVAATNGELDRTSSTEAWHYWYNYGYSSYYYSYSYYSYSYYYYPTYSYYWGGYRYSYYWCY